MRVMGCILLTVSIVGAVLAVGWLEDGAFLSRSSSGTAAVLRMGPGTTLHTVAVSYRRLGDAEEQFKELDTYVPEESVAESWTRFGDDGELASYRGEVRGVKDGLIYSTAESTEDAVVIRDGNGAEVRRMPVHRSTWSSESGNARLASFSQSLRATLDARPDAPTVTLGSREVRLIEDSQPFTRTVPAPDTLEEGERALYLPYVGDLTPVRRITREYVSESEMRVVAYQVFVVDQAGVETLVESMDFTVFEVLPD